MLPASGIEFNFADCIELQAAGDAMTSEAASVRHDPGAGQVVLDAARWIGDGDDTAGEQDQEP